MKCFIVYQYKGTVVDVNSFAEDEAADAQRQMSSIEQAKAAGGYDDGSFLVPNSCIRVDNVQMIWC
jgi:hypothetical protein